MAKSPARKPATRQKKAKATVSARRSANKPRRAGKQAHPLHKPAKASRVKGQAVLAGRPAGRSAKRATRRAATAAPAVSVPTPHGDAVATYERGLQALQSHQYDKAIELLQSVIDLYADEKELHERARLYLNVALRHSKPPDPTPLSPDERLYSATLQLNDGRYDAARETLLALERDAPPSDHVQFMLAVVDLHRGEIGASLDHLVKAVELNPENRSAALQDSELAPLREDPGFRSAIDRAAARGRRAAGRSAR